MAFSLKTHVPKRNDPEGKIGRYTPYVRINSSEGPPLFIQGGKFYSEGGEMVKDLPDWVDDEVAKMSPTAKRECGLEK
jgi:hypothetical protein